ncbi:MAG: hypothetical protein BRC43_12585 [Cyanobacteria bacterium QS_3_48_167]|nr:MAG: hypothetical protein BRC43_12585 [Cyanobacteria bacterium QS_3_48_167]
MVIVALTLTSSQFGPRLLRNFMRDTGNKVVLGTFAARFLYCLLILQTIQGGKQNVFLPKSQPLWASYWRSLDRLANLLHPTRSKLNSGGQHYR